MKAHCLFEQSGTFKNEFKKLGIEAEDYDILNDFGETNNVVDLFREIEKAYNGEPSIFDNITQNDIILAFFPCTMFQEKNEAWFRGNIYSQKDWSVEKKLEYNITRHEQVHRFYVLVSKLVIICIRKNLRMILENPYQSQHYLTRYWCIKPALVDKNRRKRGDYYQKPTQFWFINCEPMSNFIFEPIEWVDKKTIGGVKKSKSGLPVAVERSMIHPQYANRFIREFILEDKGEQRYAEMGREE